MTTTPDYRYKADLELDEFNPDEYDELMARVRGQREMLLDGEDDES